MDRTKRYFLLLADVKGSVRQSRTKAPYFMEQLLPELVRLNQRLEGDLVHPLEVNYGDEFAGLFSSPRSIYQVVSELRDLMRDTAEFRFVVAYDRIGFAGASIPEIGGPVFETAARLLSRLKKERGFSRWAVSDEPVNTALTALTNSAAALIDEMTPYQHIVYMFQKAGLSGIEIAEKLGKDSRSVSNAKKAGHSKAVIENEIAINTMLSVLHQQAREC